MAAEPGSVRLVRTEIMRWFHELRHGDDALAASIAVAVSEAVGNVVRHAYPGKGTGRVEVEAQLEEKTIVVSVSDGGKGMAARPRSGSSGMGLPVIGRLADGVTVVSDNGGTRLSMRFQLTQGGPSRALFPPLQDRSMASASH